MKKILMVLAFASCSIAGMAQNDAPEMKYSVATNSFWSNWFVSADLAYSAFYSNEEKGRGFASSPFEGFRSGLGLSVAVGKWFTPGIGLRTKINGVTGKNVISEDSKTNELKYWNAQEQVLFNLSNLFCGYNESRKWNLIPYFGTGVMRNCTVNDYAHVYSIGLLNTWKLSRNLAVNVDLGFNLSDDDITNAAATNHAEYATSIPTADRYFSAEVGITYNLGKATWSKTPDVEALKALSQSQIDALNAQLYDEQAENDRLKKELAAAKSRTVEPKTVTVEQVCAAPVSVFFELNSSRIDSRRDLQNVQAVADLAKAKNAKIVVTGYADSKTGSSDKNQVLSQKRADAVKAELLKMGFDESNIIINAEGGVDKLTPAPYNRRATVEIK